MDARIEKIAVNRRVPPGRRARDIGTVALAAVVLAILIFPFGWMVLTALRPSDSLFAPVSWESLFGGLTFDNVVALFEAADFGRYLVNSLIVAGVATLITVVLAAVAAYAFSRYSFRGRRILLLCVVATQLFPFVILITPIYSLFAQYRILNTYQGLIIAYVAITLPFSIFLMLGYFDSIPKTLDEAAQVDGAGLPTVIFKVLLPVAWPGVATVAIYAFINAWEEYLFAQILVTDNEMKTAQVALANFFGEYTTQWDLVMSASVVTALPTIVLFLIVQRRLVEGLTAGGVKE